MVDLLRLHLRELRWVSVGRCLATFESDGGEMYETTFAVERHHGIAVANDEAHLMSRFSGSADDARAVVAAVVAFCDAAE